MATLCPEWYNSSSHFGTLNTTHLPAGFVKGSLLKLRGYSGAGSACPSCGGETMRASSPFLLRPLLALLDLRIRWCRACLRQWIGRR